MKMAKVRASKAARQLQNGVLGSFGGVEISPNFFLSIRYLARTPADDWPIRTTCISKPTNCWLLVMKGKRDSCHSPGSNMLISEFSQVA